MFKKATRKKLRFASPKGMLSVEQLWDLKRSTLAEMIKNQKKVLTESQTSDDLDFLSDDIKTVDNDEKLKFDILKEVFMTLKSEDEESKENLLKKQQNEKIMALIAEKQDADLKNKSIEELKAMLK